MAVSRLRLKDLMESRLPQALGICMSDWPRVAEAVNTAQRRLLTCREAGDTGWWGGWAEMVFNVSNTDPYITTPRGIARLEKVNACSFPVEVNNQFYEYLQYGSGNLPKSYSCSSACDHIKALRRNVVPTWSDLATSGKFLRIVPTETGDTNARVLVGCRDINGTTQRQLDGPLLVQGLFATLTTPWVDLTLQGAVTPLELSAITTIQKDLTIGSVHFYEVDILTGAQRLLLTMEPGEKVAAYQRYYLHALPTNCCIAPGTTTPTTVQVNAIAKLDLVEAVVDSDYLLIQSEEAIIAEAQSARFADMDAPQSKSSSAERHQAAVRYLQGQLVHYEGKEQPAVNFAPFGSARLSFQKIGSLQ